ncbi:hypothetical protein [Amycolatopsis palatopharyngis]|uniref:hypothetical protein n=1 Tax=Amycolatopsis palatopharyngis TaxID=187982 RepID=UPI0013BEA108|nr:hypothetical protein [Amycolatopsis palatopharyngis]
MTTPTPGTRTATRAPTSLHELATTRAWYEECVGWPVHVDARLRCLGLVAGQVLDAVRLPEPLAVRTQTELRVMMLAGPVIAEQGSARWVVLTEPAPAAEAPLPRDLVAAGAIAVPRGDYIAMPIRRPGTDDGWAVPPQNRCSLPPWSAVVGAARRALASRNESRHEVRASTTRMLFDQFLFRALRKVSRGEIGTTSAARTLRNRTDDLPIRLFSALHMLRRDGYVYLSTANQDPRDGWIAAHLTPEGRELLDAWNAQLQSSNPVSTPY